MEKHSKNFRVVQEVELPELIVDGGVRTKTSSETSSAEKRSREAGDGELDFVNSEFVELRSSTRRRVMIEPVSATESFSPADSSTEPASCCSSNASGRLAGNRSTVSDPTGQTESAQLESTLTFSGGRYNRSSQATPSTESCAEEESGLMESTTVAARRLGEANSRCKSAVSDMPSEVEIEDFLSGAEKDLQKRFSEKYNFDVVKGAPLKGRYEWFPVKP